MAAKEDRYKLDRILTNLHISIRLIGITSVLQALYDAQHSPAGIGAGVPSGQILRSKVQATLSQFKTPVLQALND
jgi:hypothetical protein